MKAKGVDSRGAYACVACACVVLCKSSAQENNLCLSASPPHLIFGTLLHPPSHAGSDTSITKSCTLFKPTCLPQPLPFSPSLSPLLVNSPNAMQELMKLQADPEVMKEVEALMEDPEFQQYMAE